MYLVNPLAPTERESEREKKNVLETLKGVDVLKNVIKKSPKLLAVGLQSGEKCLSNWYSSRT